MIRHQGKQNIIRLFLAICIALLMSGCVFNSSRVEPQFDTSASDHVSETFQEYLWYENPVVLMLQIALMLAGAIGVVALLPAPYEEEGSE